MADLSKAIINGETYLFKDQEARDKNEQQDELIKEKLSSQDSTDISGVFNFINGIKLNGISVEVTTITEESEKELTFSDSEEEETVLETNTYIIFG